MMMVMTPELRTAMTATTVWVSQLGEPAPRTGRSPSRPEAPCTRSRHRRRRGSRWRTSRRGVNFHGPWERTFKTWSFKITPSPAADLVAQQVHLVIDEGETVNQFVKTRRTSRPGLPQLGGEHRDPQPAPDPATVENGHPSTVKVRSLQLPAPRCRCSRRGEVRSADPRHLTDHASSGQLTAQIRYRDIAGRGHVPLCSPPRGWGR